MRQLLGNEVLRGEIGCLRYEIFREMVKKNIVLWDATPRLLVEVYQRLGRTFYLRHPAVYGGSISPENFRKYLPRPQGSIFRQLLLLTRPARNE
jgi:hypothetical protein